MEEMTNEEKAERYDEAIKRAKELLEIGLKDTRDKRVVLSFFPELAESEGERIRKELIDFLEYYRLNNVLDSKTISILTDSVAWLEKKSEQKPAEWSEDDQSNFNELSSFILETYRTEDASRLITWLNDIKDRVQLQPKQEWSEEDESILDHIIVFLRTQRDVLLDNDANWLKNKLKSLRPQSQWRPSDEQMDALETAVSSLQSTALESLYQDLKRL